MIQREQSLADPIFVLENSLAVHYHQLVFEEHSLAVHCHCSTVESKC